MRGCVCFPWLTIPEAMKLIQWKERWVLAHGRGGGGLWSIDPLLWGLIHHARERVAQQAGHLTATAKQGQRHPCNHQPPWRPILVTYQAPPLKDTPLPNLCTRHSMGLPLRTFQIQTTAESRWRGSWEGKGEWLVLGWKWRDASSRRWHLSWRVHSLGEERFPCKDDMHEDSSLRKSRRQGSSRKAARGQLGLGYGQALVLRTQMNSRRMRETERENFWNSFCLFYFKCLFKNIF